MANITMSGLMEKYNQYEYCFTDDEDDFWARGLMWRIGVPEMSLGSAKDDDVFRLLHEIGHCQTMKRNQSKATREYLATQWAINMSTTYGIYIPEDDRHMWQTYIYSFDDARNKSKHKLDWSPMERG